MKSSELILNNNGSIYHLGLQPQHIADTIITVGDQDRVAAISKYFSKLEYAHQNREFVTHIGEYRGKWMMVISTGIGTDNVDIVLNELHALANVDFASGEPNKHFKKLRFIRIGTSGAVQKEIEVNSFVISKLAVGLDGLMHFYDVPQPIALLKEFKEKLPTFSLLPTPYFTQANTSLTNILLPVTNLLGTTLTAPGFYAPQGRAVNLKPKVPTFINDLRGVSLNGTLVTNLEMETAGIYGLAGALGHEAVSISALLANRATGAFSTNPTKVVDELIEKVLNCITHA